MVGKSKIYPYMLVLPALAVLIVMIGIPLAYGVGTSFTNRNIYHFMPGSYGFVGIKNYIDIILDPVLYKTTWTTIIWTFTNVFFHVTMGLFLALVINRKLPFKNFFRTLLMIPWAMPQYIAVITWKNMFRGQYGAIDIMLNKIGITGISWLSDPTWAFRAAIITNIWLGVPFMMVTILGGLQSIPHELYEAAEMDGIKSFAKLKSITLPLLKPVLIPSIILGCVMTFNMVNVIFIMTDGTGNNETNILVTYVYKMAFNLQNYGGAAAWSVVIFFMLAAFSTFFIKAMKGDEGVYD